MSAAYDAFIKRLIEYRKNNDLSQEEMGKRTNLTQSHYNKIENRNKIMSYNSLVVLNSEYISADFLITGIEQKETVLNDLLMQCGETDKADFLYMAVICIELVIKYHGVVDETYKEISTKEIEVLRSDMEEENTADYSVWKCIRKLSNLTQEQMSQELDIDIKTYRDIEKGKSKPNVEILALVYEKLGYPPSLFFEVDNKNYLYAINEVWLRLPAEMQNIIEKELRGFLDFISSIRESSIVLKKERV